MSSPPATALLRPHLQGTVSSVEQHYGRLRHRCHAPQTRRLQQSRQVDMYMSCCELFRASFWCCLSPVTAVFAVQHSCAPKWFNSCRQMMSASAALTSCNINGKRCSHCKQLIGTCNKMVSTGSAVALKKRAAHEPTVSTQQPSCQPC